MAAEFNDRITRKVIGLAEQELVESGWGPPPEPFCWLALGSAGRREQVLRTDQDNALVYRDPSAGAEAAARYFAALAAKVVEGLATAGFALCTGNVMASNPALCRPLGEWCRALAGWVARPVPDVVRLVGLLLDFRPVYGDTSLADRLRERAQAVVGGAPGFLYALVRDDLLRPLPVEPFNRLVGERSGSHRGEIDLKSSACVHVVDGIRALAVRAGIGETATLGRLRRLVQAGLFPPDEVELLEAGFETLMTMRLRENLRKLAAGQAPDNYVRLDSLSRLERFALREALLAVARLRRIMAETVVAHN